MPEERSDQDPLQSIIADILDAEANVFEVSGRSFPLNAKGFYMPILEWLVTLLFKSLLFDGNCEL